MFVHLHVHSHFSFKEALPSPQALAEQTAKLGMGSIALTDHNTLAGAIRFYTACQQAGIKPIVGCEVDLRNGGSLVLLCRDMTGYSNLCNLLTAVNMASPEGPFAVSPRELLPFSRGLICLLTEASLPGEDIGTLKSMFDDSLYVELCNPLTREGQAALRRQAALAEQLNLPTVVTNNVHFLLPEDHAAREILLAIGENRQVLGESPHSQANSELHLKSAEAMRRLFPDYAEALARTVAIAAKCNLELPLGRFHFPYFIPPPGKDSSSYLSQLCYEGMAAFYRGRETPAKRLEYELKVINDLGFAEYFLVVWDIVSFARREGIRHSCRGSAAGSLVSYVLGLTAVDPVEHDLLFERFLNPERKGMPDIDMDFDSARRDEVLAYVYERYQADRVAMVGTVNTFNARSAVRDVSKCLGFSNTEIDRIARFIPHTSAGRLNQAIDELPELKHFPRGDKYRRLLNLCTAIDECPRHLSVHAGGVVISRDKLTDLVPLQWSAKGVVITQYDKDDLETLGLVKMDLLGLRILSAIEDTVRALAKNGVNLDIAKVPLDDGKTYALLQSTRTVGVFQLESPGMRELLGRLQPSVFADVMANIALFRPGPMQANMIAPFLARRHGLETPDYAHPCLIPVLEETYGVIVFQEQVLQVAAHMGKFSLGQGDILRRTMTKDCPPQRMQELESAFVQGAASQGVSEEAARRVFGQLSAFAAYGFNKAHAATFGLIAYHTAYLKAHFPAHFYAGLLNHQPMGFYPANTVLHDARNMGLKILPPCLFDGDYAWRAEDSSVRMGLKDISGMNQEHYEAVVSARGHTLRNMPDMLRKMPLPKKLWQNLVDCGALDDYGRRQELIRLLDSHNWARATRKQDQCSFLDADAPQKNDPPAQAQPSMMERLHGEFRSTGMCYSSHPMQSAQRLLPKHQVTESCDLPYCADGQRVKVAGLVVSRQTPPTRSKQRVIFLTLEDCSGLVDVAVFASAQKTCAQAALSGGLLLVEGTLRKTGARGISVTASNVRGLGDGGMMR